MACATLTGTPRIVIVGGGFAGTMVAANLLVAERADDVEIVLVERDARTGPGVAFGTWRIDHLLNVPAGQMSAWPRDPSHFVRWAECVGGVGDRDFAPRRTYGRYLEAVLVDSERAASPRARLVRIRGDVHDIRTTIDGGSRVVLASGRTIDADQVVLAVGTPAPATPDGIDPELLGGAYVANPWAQDALDHLPHLGRILLVGTGLTMVDIALAIRERPGLAIDALSRRGLLPRVHAATGTPPALALPAAPTARSLVRAVRAAIANTPDGDWRAVVSALRPQTRAIWSSLDTRERSRLLRRVGRHWDVHRHRMPPSVAAQIEDLRASGRLRVDAGCITAVAPRNDRLDVTIERPGRLAPETRRIDAIINCTGPQANPRFVDEPLLRRLLERGTVRVDALRMGLEVDERSRLLGAATGSPPILALGWVCRGSRLESTAVPELRVDAEQVARQADETAAMVRRRRTASFSGTA